MPAAQPFGPELQRLIELLAKVPGLGPRSARRAALGLLRRKESLMLPLGDAIETAAARVNKCSICGNLDTRDPCSICSDPARDKRTICVVEEVSDVWALERANVFHGLYHVLGGVLSAIDGIGPDDLAIAPLVARARAGLSEVILATNATVDGQATAHYVTDALQSSGVKVTRLAYGVPVGGELDYLDEGTLKAALQSRRPM
ncbi:MAG: recombination mediator RecR [Alphaproteobacteria bacterium]